MNCPACDAPNPDAAKFCSSCGQALAAACASCGHLNLRASRFCSECGHPLEAPALEPQFASPRSYTPQELAEKIASARPALEGERKQVSVLFVDVAGFTSMAESLDPEDVQAIMRRCFDLMLSEVHRYEGTVSQFLGDGILALFGAPIAHEDHAHRAVRAALGIQHALASYQKELWETRGIVFRVRCGINSGPVVVSSVGADLTMNYLAVGDTVNMAARMQTLAQPGAVAISRSTERLISGYFITRDLGGQQVKGRDQPQAVYEVLAPSRWRSRVDLYSERGLSPLVGRQAELETLLQRFQEAKQGHGLVVFVRGDAGIGKSRLLYELKRRLEGETLAWVEGRCIPYGRDISYLPIVDLLKDRFEIEETDTEVDIARKADDGARALGEAAVEGLPYFKYLLGVDPGDPSVGGMDPQMRKARIFETLRRLLIGASAARPQIIVIEDIHWIDPLSEEYLSYVAEEVPGHPILLILTHRSGHDHRLGQRPDFFQIDLHSLSEGESGVIAQAVLGAQSVPVELNELICRKAEGNPFFIEEVTKSLVEVGAIRPVGSTYVLARPIEEILVPDTVQGVIMARLDRLPDEPKRAIQTASVIGREFAVRILERTAEMRGPMEDYLRDLKGLELIYERSLYPELAYMFKHALTHDVAYNSLLLARRKALHRVVGAAIEELYADRLAEHYETLAHHYEQGEAWEQALDYLLKSGQKALDAFAPAQAVAFYDRALALADRAGPSASSEAALALHANRGQALYLLSEFDRSIESFQALLAAARAAGDRNQEAVGLRRICLAYTQAHRFEEALAYAEEAGRFAQLTGNRAVLAASRTAVGLVRATTGELGNARVALDEALQAAAHAGVPDVQTLAIQIAGLLPHWQGDHARALELFDEGTRLGRQHQLADALMRNGWSRGLALCGQGEYDRALQCLTESLELSTRIGERFYRCRILNTLGWVYIDLCNWNLGLHFNGLGAAESRVLGHPEIIRNAELNLGDCYLALGQLDRAQAYLETVQAESEQTGDWGGVWMSWRYTQHMNASLGELWLARGDAEGAIVYARRCIEPAEATGSRRNIVKGRRLQAEALLAQGKLAEAEADLEQALRFARGVGNPAQLWKTLAAVGRLRQAQGQAEAGAAAFEEAIATIEEIAGRLSEAEIRSALLTSPQMAALRAALVL